VEGRTGGFHKILDREPHDEIIRTGRPTGRSSQGFF
jgi:hypothetical protein